MKLVWDGFLHQKNLLRPSPSDEHRGALLSEDQEEYLLKGFAYGLSGTDLLFTF